MHSGSSLVPKMCCADPKVFATSSHGIPGYIPLVATFMFIFFFLIEGMFIQNNHKISLMHDMFISYDL